MTGKNNYLVEAKGLSRIYNDGEVRALDNVSFTVSNGELVAIMGPSGSGKSTLLNMLGALDKPNSGEVYINGQNLAEIKDVDMFRAKTVGFVFQLHNLLPTMNAQENVEIPMMGHAGSKERKERAKYLLEMVGLGDRMKHLPNQLSGGQRQRVAVARALANNPPLILADEPTGSLDSESGRSLIRLLHEINEKEGTTFILVTHDPSVSRQTNRVITMSDGKIEREDLIGSPIEEDLKMWKHSGLGKRLAENRELDGLDLNETQIKVLKEILSSTGN